MSHGGEDVIGNMLRSACEKGLGRLEIVSFPMINFQK